MNTMDVNSKHMDRSTSSFGPGKSASQDAGPEDQDTFSSSEYFDDASDTFSLIGNIGSRGKRSANGKDLSEDDLEELKQIFGIFDQDNDGQIAASELRNIIGSLGQSTTEAEIMDMVDSIGKLKSFSKRVSKINVPLTLVIITNMSMGDQKQLHKVVGQSIKTISF